MTEDVMRRRRTLERHLQHYSLTPEDLLAEVTESFGPVLLVTATGSVPLGWGNLHSDIDLEVVVDTEKKLSQLPIMIYRNGARVDILYIADRQWQSRIELARESPWPPGDSSRKTWGLMNESLFTCTRFGQGVTLQAEPDHQTLVRTLHEPWLASQAKNWWMTEAIRCWVVAEWVSPHNWQLGAERYCDAALAALSALAADHLQVYMSNKWLPQKLRALEDASILELLREALDRPPSQPRLTSYRHRVWKILRRLGIEKLQADSHRRLQLWPGDGIELRMLGKEALVTRWNLRTLALRGLSYDRLTPGQPCWEGHLAETPDDSVMKLMLADMLWLGVANC